jgi:hypothetical protein
VVQFLGVKAVRQVGTMGTDLVRDNSENIEVTEMVYRW